MAKKLYSELEYIERTRYYFLKYFSLRKGILMTNRLKNKVAVIIGASKGIGRGIAHVYAKEGAKLLLTGRNQKLLENVVSEISEDTEAQYYLGDVTNEQDMHGLVDRATECYGRIDILCVNAGIYPEAWLGKMTLAQWSEVIATNLTSVFLATNACLPQIDLPLVSTFTCRYLFSRR